MAASTNGNSNGNGDKWVGKNWRWIATGLVTMLVTAIPLLVTGAATAQQLRSDVDHNRESVRVLRNEVALRVGLLEEVNGRLIRVETLLQRLLDEEGHR